MTNTAASFMTSAPHRGLLRLSGDDCLEFLQGLLSNDLTKVTPTRGIWAALLTPQGKFLHDLFILQDGQGRLLLEAEKDRLPDLLKRLKLYRLRSKVDITELPDWSVALLWGPAVPGLVREDNALAEDSKGVSRSLALPALSTDSPDPEASNPAGSEEGRLLGDPRLASAGARLYLPHGSDLSALTSAGFAHSEFAAWDQHRLRLGLPDGSRDLQVDKALLLESGFDELEGVDWKKGCYVGQELTARTRYRGLVKKRLLPVTLNGPAPDSGSQILLDGKDAGTFFSHSGTDGLALLRLKALEQAQPGQLTCGDTKLTAQIPDWTILPQPPVT
ncbi:CAF17-like 4Fe-4S cluster assembly/insertion protein YgfZ [Rhodovibrionaceae bacterium A322]